MTTKQVLRDLESPRDFSKWGPCRVCLNVFDQQLSATTRYKPQDVCAWCYSRCWPRFKRATEALDRIANTPCLGDGSDDCTCVTCFAGRIYDELFDVLNPKPEADESEESSTEDRVLEKVVDGSG